MRFILPPQLSTSRLAPEAHAACCSAQWRHNDGADSPPRTARPGRSRKAGFVGGLTLTMPGALKLSQDMVRDVGRALMHRHMSAAWLCDLTPFAKARVESRGHLEGLAS
jgi:hypothetical protein